MQPQFQLSVIIPHLNEPDNLRRCLTCLDSQRSKGVRFEIIVVDNGSTQMPREVCSGIPDLRLCHEPSPGPGPARNLGAALAKSELLAFIDADCAAEANWAASIIDTMTRYPEIDVIGGDISLLMADPQNPTAVEAFEAIYSYRARDYVERHGFAATGNMAVRRDIFRQVGPFGGIATMEDTQWGQRATAQGCRISFLPEARVLTPSCMTFAELARRWDRHVAHDYQSVDRSHLAKITWIARCAALAISPVAEIITVIRSKRVSGIKVRLRAWSCLARIRLYRARLMLDLARHGHSIELVEGWNR